MEPLGFPSSGENVIKWPLRCPSSGQNLVKCSLFTIKISPLSAGRYPLPPTFFCHVQLKRLNAKARVISNAFIILMSGGQSESTLTRRQYARKYVSY